MTVFEPSTALRNSLLIHLAIATLAMVVTYGPTLSLHFSPTTEIPFEVIEAPRPAAMPLEPRALPKPPAPKSRAVFGLSRKSITSSDSAAPETKAGNTLAKAEDQTKLRDEDADSLPIPTDDYLVSQMPVLVGDFRVPYPSDARKAGVQGAVLLDLLIDAEGRVRQAQVLKPLFASLDQAALEAAKKLVFKPARVGKQSVAVRIRYAYRFVLE